MERVPAVRRRRLGEELRRLRDSAALTSGEAARRAGWHQSKVSRI
ncbi:helix-turn-helix domain-containing protein, partial [Actinacidiphila rubida]